MTDRRDRRAAAIALALVVALVAGCAPRATVVLLPEQDGRKTAVTVTQGDTTVVLDEPYAAAKQTAFGAPTVYKSDAKEVEAIAGPALAAQPARRKPFTLYFVEGKDEFTDESKRVVETIFAEIAARPLPDIVVVGHTDQTGTNQLNDALGQRRADIVKNQLVSRGVPAANIESTSRGMREPAVPPPPSGVEPRNRRVEIVVR